MRRIRRYVHQCQGKIKQAYGLAFDAAGKQLIQQAGLSPEQRVQAERDAGRKAEIATVSQFLGDVPIDHFVEVTLVAFFQIAQVVQPMTVCLNEATQDSSPGRTSMPACSRSTHSRRLDRP